MDLARFLAGRALVRYRMHERLFRVRITSGDFSRGALSVLVDEEVYASHGTEEDISDLVGDVRAKIPSADDVPGAGVFLLKFHLDRPRDVFEMLLRVAASTEYGDKISTRNDARIGPSSSP